MSQGVVIVMANSAVVSASARTPSPICPTRDKMEAIDPCRDLVPLLRQELGLIGCENIQIIFSIHNVNALFQYHFGFWLICFIDKLASKIVIYDITISHSTCLSKALQSAVY